MRRSPSGLAIRPSVRFIAREPAIRTLIGLVQSRLPIKNEQMIEELLSYGFLDWAIRDYEARFAYELIRLMPMSAQYRFRQRDGGKWYLRLLDNLPDAGSRPGVTSEGAEEIKRLKAENKRLREANEILRKASIFFAGELDPRNR